MPHTKAYTFCSRFNQPTDQSCKKSMLFSTQDKIVFKKFPSLQKNKNTQTLNPRQTRTIKGFCLTQTDLHLDTNNRRASANSGFKKLAETCLNEVLCFVSSLVLADSLQFRNRQLLVAANRQVVKKVIFF